MNSAINIINSKIEEIEQRNLRNMYKSRYSYINRTTLYEYPEKQYLEGLLFVS